MVYSFLVREINASENRMGFCGKTRIPASAPSKTREICRFQWMRESFWWCHRRWKLFQLPHTGRTFGGAKGKGIRTCPRWDRNSKQVGLWQQKLEAAPLWFGPLVALSPSLAQPPLSQGALHFCHSCWKRKGWWGMLISTADLLCLCGQAHRNVAFCRKAAGGSKPQRVTEWPARSTPRELFSPASFHIYSERHFSSLYLPTSIHQALWLKTSVCFPSR